MRTILISLLCLLLFSTACSNKPEWSHDSKIWLHKANNIEKAQHFQYDYSGFEIDVHYIDSLDTFIIKHDADEPSSLTLDSWCEALKNVSNLGIWFDFKNLDEHNSHAALACLTKIRKRYHLQGKLYVESHAYNELKAFRDAGFRTSFYIPYFNPYKDDSVTCNKRLPEIQDAINSGVDAISGYEFQYKFMKKHFPSQTKLIWTVSVDSAYLKQIINNIGSDTLVDVLLLPNTSFDR